MTKRVYGQYCGFARALEMVGERWALLIVRDLLVNPKRFTDLRHGLPGIPTNILTARLKELEDAGIVQRRVMSRQAGGGVVYDLTPYGYELEDVVVRLGLWGAKTLGEPRANETVTVDSLVTALRTTFRPEFARKAHVGYELRFGDIVLHAQIDDGRIKVAQGPLPDADLIIETGPAMKGLMSGELSPAQAIEQGLVRLTGDPQLLTRFVEMFHIGSMPAA